MCAAVCGDVSALESGCRGEQLDIYIYILCRDCWCFPSAPVSQSVHVCIDYHIPSPLKVAAVDNDLDEV
jgi:hypothetical protein